MYNFSGDFKGKLHDIITDNTELMKETPREERMKAMDELIDDYVEQTGERPDGSTLERLANLVLHEELSDSHPDKMTREETPILSDRMQAVRQEGRERKKNSAGVTTTEVPIEHGQNVATDGSNYTLPVRSFTNPW